MMELLLELKNLLLIRCKSQALIKDYILLILNVEELSMDLLLMVELSLVELVRRPNSTKKILA